MWGAGSVKARTVEGQLGGRAPVAECPRCPCLPPSIFPPTFLCPPPVQVPPSHHKPGTVVHTMGYPLGHETYGGGFIYHMADNKVCAGRAGGSLRPLTSHSREEHGGTSGRYR